MAASGYTMIALGLPCVFLGIYLRKGGPKAEPKGEKAPKKEKKKKGGGKSKKTKKVEDKPPQKSAEGGSLIWGGLAFTLLGLGFIIADAMK